MGGASIFLGFADSPQATPCRPTGLRSCRYAARGSSKPSIESDQEATNPKGVLSRSPGQAQRRPGLWPPQSQPQRGCIKESPVAALSCRDLRTHRLLHKGSRCLPTKRPRVSVRNARVSGRGRVLKAYNIEYVERYVWDGTGWASRRAEYTTPLGLGSWRRHNPGRRCACPGLRDTTPLGFSKEGIPESGQTGKPAAARRRQSTLHHLAVLWVLAFDGHHR